MPLTLTITDAGRAALVNAQHSGTAPVEIVSCGLSATAVVPAKTATTLPGEFKRVAVLSGSAVAADAIHLIVRDDSADGYSARSLALYLSTGTLFGIYGQATPIVEKTAQTIFMASMDVLFADIDAAALTFGNTNFINPQATETVKGVAEIATQAETDAGVDDARIVTPKKLAARLTSWLASWGADIWRASNDGAGSGMDADLLDGQQGYWYSDIPGRLGYYPANRAGDTFLGPVAFEGGAVSAFVAMRAPPGHFAYHGFQRSGVRRWDVGMDSMWETGGNAGSDFFIRAFDDAGNPIVTALRISRATGTVSFSGPLDRAGNIIWDAGNDGSGSGLDADMLDGIQASGFIRASTGVWQQSEDGIGRLYFAPNARTYFGTGGTGWAWQYQGSDRAALDVNGNFFPTGIVRVGVGGALAELQTGGDIVASRTGGATGAYFFGTGNSRYLYFDGANFNLVGSPTLFINSAVAWTAANDGAGSGADADLLDGQQGSWYTDILARLGWTPLNKAGDTLTGKLTTAGAVTGGWSMGTGTGYLGSVEVMGNGAGAALMSFHRPGSFASYFGLDSDNRWKVGGWSMGAVAYDLWHAGNDGAGSGMDTDLWRGQTPEQLMAAQFTNGFVAGRGYWARRPDGIIDQWGVVTMPASGGAISGATINFPIEFTDAASIGVELVAADRPGPARECCILRTRNDPTTASIAIYGDANEFNGDGRFYYEVRVRWRAIGK